MSEIFAELKAIKALVSENKEDKSADVTRFMMKHLGPQCTGRMWKGLQKAWLDKACIDKIDADKTNVPQAFCLYVLEYFGYQLGEEKLRQTKLEGKGETKEELPIPTE